MSLFVVVMVPEIRFEPSAWCTTPTQLSGKGSAYKRPRSGTHLEISLVCELLKCVDNGVARDLKFACDLA